MLTSGRDSTVRLWDVGSGRELVRYEGAVHSEGSTPAVFDVTGKWVICGDDSYAQLCVWDVEGGEVVRRLGGHTKPIRTMSVDKEEEVMVSGGEDGRVRIWSVQDKDEDTEP